MNWKFWKEKVDPALVLQQEMLLELSELSDKLEGKMSASKVLLASSLDTLHKAYRAYQKDVKKETRKLERARAKMGEKARRMKTKYRDRRKGSFDTADPEVQKALEYMAGEHWIICRSCGKGYYSNYSRCFSCARMTLSNILEMLEDGDNLI